MKLLVLHALFPLITCVQLGAGERSSYVLASPKSNWLNREALSMLALERETTANRLTGYVVNHLISGERPDRDQWARRLLGLALILHPKNPRAQQTNDAMASGSALPEVGSELESDVLGRLLFHRAQGLSKGSESDVMTSKYLLAAAAYIAPYFEEAVFVHERQHLEEGSLNWEPICGEASKKNPISNTTR